MSVSNERFRQSDVYIDYDFEGVMFRYEHGTRRFFCKFYGKSTEVEVAYNDRLLNDAIRFGDETDFKTYRAGKKASWRRFGRVGDRS